MLSRHLKREVRKVRVYVNKIFKKALKNVRGERGISTVEIAIIVAVLVGIALIFRGAIMGFVNDIISNMFPPTTQFDNTQVQ